LASNELSCYTLNMKHWSQKMRMLFAVLALGLSWHYAVLAAHLACEVHPNCDEDSGQIFGSASSEDHEHCLVQINPSRVQDTSIEDDAAGECTEVLFARVLPVAPRVVKASRTPRRLMVRSRGDFQFTHSVRIIS
jgi:hypothetical protein